MTKSTVVEVRTASRTYDVIVGSGLLDQLGALMAGRGLACDAAIVVTDTNVAPLYLERALAALTKAGLRASSVVIEAGEKYEPSIVTRHIVSVAQAFNKFYHDEQILVDSEDEKLAKLALVISAGLTIKNGLALLGIQAPERM